MTDCDCDWSLLEPNLELIEPFLFDPAIADAKWDDELQL
jgi:hypothetical protein